MGKAVTDAAPAYQASDVLNAELMGDERTMYELFDYLREHDPVARCRDAGADSMATHAIARHSDRIRVMVVP